jgi:chemotaxis signal transduction protein
MTRVRRAEDRLRRAVVLLELDDGRVGIVVLEVEDVADVGAAEAVDRVVGDEPFGDEVVRVLDVEVVHRRVERNPLDALDDVVAAVLGEHRHPRAAPRCGG